MHDRWKREPQVATLYALGLSMKEVGKVLGFSPAGVMKILERFEVYGPPIKRGKILKLTEQEYQASYYRRHKDAIRVAKALRIPIPTARGMIEERNSPR